LLATFAFLFLISMTILKTTGATQQIMFLVSDLVLWVSLVLFISLMYADVSGGSKKTMIGVFCVFALMRTMFQLAGILLITFTWAFRLLAAASVAESTAFILVSGASLVGFILLLAGVFYRGREVSSQPMQQVTT